MDQTPEPAATLNIASYSDDWRSRLLSTFAHTPFELRCGNTAIRCASVEGFWQGLKWPEGSPERTRIFGLWALEAKLAGQAAPATIHVRFCGQDVALGSADHHELARTAMQAKLNQNLDVQRALEATDELIFTHILLDDAGRVYPDSLTLPAATFCAIWTELRGQWRAERTNANPAERVR